MHPTARGAMKLCPALPVPCFSAGVDRVRSSRLVLPLLLLWVGGFLPGFLRAATPGEIESRLREAIRMPMVNLELNFGFNSRQGLEAWDPVIDPAAEIARLEKAMVQSDADAERWLKIARLRGELNDEAGARAAHDRGMALLRERLKARPDDARAMAALGEALPTDEAEAERLLRGAVSRAPRDWQCHLSLARWLSARWMISTRMPAEAGEENRPIPDRATLEALDREAREHFDEAVDLAPKEVEPLLQRALHRWMTASSASRPDGPGDAGKEPQSARQLMSTVVLPDVRAAERTSPDDFRLLALRLFFLGMSAAPEEASGPVASAVPEYIRRELLDGLARMRRLAEGATEPGRAAAVWEAMGMLQFSLLQDAEGALESTRRALSLQPGRPRAWGLQLALLHEGPSEKFLGFLEETVRRTNTARVRIYLAKEHYNKGRLEAAAREVKEALRLEPENPTARGCDLALRLRSARTMEEFIALKLDMDKLAPQFPSIPDPAARQMLAENVWVNSVILAALAGEMETARSNLAKARKAIPDSKYAAEIASILGPETGQAP